MHAHRPNSYVWTDVTVTVRIIIKNKTSMIIKSLFLRIRFINMFYFAAQQSG